MSDLEKRMTKAEYVLEAQADQIEELEEALKGLSTTLNGIEKLLAQIKWIAVGALLVVAISDHTFSATLMKLLS